MGAKSLCGHVGIIGVCTVESWIDFVFRKKTDFFGPRFRPFVTKCCMIQWVHKTCLVLQTQLQSSHWEPKAFLFIPKWAI